MSDDLVSEDPAATGLGQETVLSFDLQGDGVVDAEVGDLTGDGMADYVSTLAEEGSVVTAWDRDGAGGFDTLITDYGGEGTPDLVETDLDGDQVPDVVQADADQDGYLETTEFAGTGTTLVTGTDGLVLAVEETGPAEVTPDAYPAYSPEDVLVADPSAAVAAEPEPAAEDLVPAGDALHGDPVAEAELWFEQAENGFCVPASVAMIVAEFTGADGAAALEDDTVGAAVELGLLTGGPGDWSGLTADQAEVLLEHFGVEAHVETGSADALRQYLDEGRSVMVGVDSDEVWYPAVDDDTAADAGPDHAVVVTGVDDEAGVVYLNDPGSPDGRGWTMSLADFEDAWADGGNQMVVTDGAPAAEILAAGEAPMAARADGGSPIPGFVLLPVRIAGEAVRRLDAAIG